MNKREKEIKDNLNLIRQCISDDAIMAIIEAQDQFRNKFGTWPTPSQVIEHMVFKAELKTPKRFGPLKPTTKGN